MGILFGFQAHDITTVVTDTIVDDNSTIVQTTPIVADPVSDAVNNVRFACNGFAAEGDLAFISMRARSFFRFQIPEASRITVFGHLTFGGVSTLTGRAQTWFLDRPGFARMFLTARMRVRVVGENGQTVFTRHSPERTLFDRFRRGTNHTRTRTDFISAGLMEEFLTVTPPEAVLPEDRINVRMQYTITALSVDGGEFILDFDGSGLNVPMVVVNY
jgi:hypothetical protein